MQLPFAILFALFGAGFLFADKQRGEPLVELLHSIENQRGEIEAVEKALKDAGRPTTDRPEDYWIWYRGLEKRKRKLADSFPQLQGRMRSNVLRLWILSGVPGPIPDSPSSSIGDRIDDITVYYRRMIDNKVDFRESIARNIENNIGLLKTEYAWIAYQALNENIWFTPRVHVSEGAFDVLPLSKNYCDSLAQAFSIWFNDHKHELTWDAGRGWFTSPDGSAFVLPEVVKALEFQSATQPADDGDGDRPGQK